MSEMSDSFYGSEPTEGLRKNERRTSEHSFRLNGHSGDGQKSQSETASELSYQQSESSSPKQTKDLDLIKSILHNASDSSGSTSEKADKSNDSHSSLSSSSDEDENGNNKKSAKNNFSDSEDESTAKRKPRRMRARRRVSSAKRGRPVSAVNITKKSSSPSREPKETRRYSEDDINLKKLTKEQTNQKKQRGTRRRQRQALVSHVEPQAVNAAYSHKLEEKYAELRDLMQHQYAPKKRGAGLYEGQTGYTEADYHGNMGVHLPPRPPLAARRHGARRQFAPADSGTPRSARSESSTQTDLMSLGTLGNDRWEYQGGSEVQSTGIVIDVNTGKSRHVKFSRDSAEKRKDADGGSVDNEQKDTEQKGHKSKRSRSGKKRPKSPKNSEHFTAKQEGNSTVFRMAAPGAAPPRSPSQSSANYTTDESETESRGRSQSPVFHQLKVTENDKILDWLREKNKIYRKQKAEERKKKRAERRKKQKEIEEQEAKQPKIREAVDDWMKKKKKEVRLLKRRERQKNSDGLKFSGTVTISETVDLKDGEKVEGATENAEDGAEITTANDAKLTSEKKSGFKCSQKENRKDQRGQKKH